MFYRLLLLLTAVAAGTIAASAVLADEIAGKPWPASDQVSIDQVAHDSYDGLLKKYVDENGMVDYRRWHASSVDRLTLRRYLESLGRANPNMASTKENKLAFWINAYNALTIEGILRVYPTTSIRNHTARLVGYNIWKNLYLHVGREKVTLDHIEHQVLRKMNEPRIHFAIVCASIGCPRLLNEAYVGNQLESQLVLNATDFFARKQNLSIDQRGTLSLSQIVSWFGSDFGDSERAQLQALVPYFPPAAKEVVASGRYRVKFLEYDWDLNAQK